MHGTNRRAFLKGSAAVGAGLSMPLGVQAGTAGTQRLTGKNVTIAVIDSGVDASHPEFAKNNKSRVALSVANERAGARYRIVGTAVALCFDALRGLERRCSRHGCGEARADKNKRENGNQKGIGFHDGAMGGRGCAAHPPGSQSRAHATSLSEQERLRFDPFSRQLERCRRALHAE